MPKSDWVGNCEYTTARVSIKLLGIKLKSIITSPHIMATTITKPASQPPMRERVQNVINLIRPAVQADGGDIELVDVTDAGVVQIRFHGACHGCPSSHMTLQTGIERNLREQIPEVTQVVPVK
jgi:Fe-S cluster biogenesis protein NfuA